MNWKKRMLVIRGKRGSGKTLELAKLSRENKLPLVVNYKHQVSKFNNENTPECYKFHDVMTIDEYLAEGSKNYFCIDDVGRFLSEYFDSHILATLNEEDTFLDIEKVYFNDEQNYILSYLLKGKVEYNYIVKINNLSSEIFANKNRKLTKAYLSLNDYQINAVIQRYIKIMEERRNEYVKWY